jgi:hypothetical protein
MSMERSVQIVKQLVPPRARPLLRRGARAMTTRLAQYTGVLPDFLIIGAQRCGTTSLYNYLIQHPCIYPATTKEVGYFDRYHSPDIRWYRAKAPCMFRQDDLRWYRAHFPSIFRQYYAMHLARRPFITGEASTGYILNPHALRRISALLPHARLILLLRNPVDRAYSHYQHSWKAGKESLPFEEALEHEEARIGAAWERMLVDETYYSIDIAWYAYVRTGVYVDQIKVLRSLVPQEQVLIIKSEEFYTDPPSTVKLICEFLQVPSWDLKDRSIYNGHSNTTLKAATRQRLVEYFKPHNQQLSELLGIPFDWDQ